VRHGNDIRQAAEKALLPASSNAPPALPIAAKPAPKALPAPVGEHRLQVVEVDAASDAGVSADADGSPELDSNDGSPRAASPNRNDRKKRAVNTNESFIALKKQQIALREKELQFEKEKQEAKLKLESEKLDMQRQQFAAMLQTQNQLVQVLLQHINPKST
jgi:hypothetical protein